jgi:hypothetical protein
MRHTVKDLMNLGSENYKKLNIVTLPNNDHETDDKAWKERGIANAQAFARKSENVLNLILNNKKS